MSWLTWGMTGWMGVLLYWIPLFIVAIVYTCRFVKAYQTDIDERSGKLGGTWYAPKLTVGSILGHIIIATVPVVNLIACVFDCGWCVLKEIMDTCKRLLDISLVPDSPKYKAMRKKNSG